MKPSDYAWSIVPWHNKTATCSNCGREYDGNFPVIKGDLKTSQTWVGCSTKCVRALRAKALPDVVQAEERLEVGL